MNSCLLYGFGIALGYGFVVHYRGGKRLLALDRVDLFTTFLDLILVFTEIFFSGIIGLFIMAFPISLLVSLDPVLNTDTRFSNKIKAKMRSNPEQYTTKDYIQAAEILAKITPASYKKQCQRYTKRLVDLLLCINSIYPMKRKIKRIVSLKSIKEDRDAGPNDE